MQLNILVLLLSIMIFAEVHSFLYDLDDYDDDDDDEECKVNKKLKKKLNETRNENQVLTKRLAGIQQTQQMMDKLLAKKTKENSKLKEDNVSWKEYLLDLRNEVEGFNKNISTAAWKFANEKNKCCEDVKTMEKRLEDKMAESIGVRVELNNTKKEQVEKNINLERDNLVLTQQVELLENEKKEAAKLCPVLKILYSWEL